MHPQTLRMYEARGLIEPQALAQGHAPVLHADVERLRRIQEMTAELGLNLAGVERVFELEHRLDAWPARFDALERTLRPHSKWRGLERCGARSAPSCVPEIGPLRARGAARSPPSCVPRRHDPKAPRTCNLIASRSSPRRRLKPRSGSRRSAATRRLVPAHLLARAARAGRRRGRCPWRKLGDRSRGSPSRRQALTQPGSTRCRDCASARRRADHRPNELTEVLRAADAETRALGDDYVSTEHLLLALPSARAGRASCCAPTAQSASAAAGDRTRFAAAPTTSPTRPPRRNSRRSSSFGRDLTRVADTASSTR